MNIFRNESFSFILVFLVTTSILGGVGWKLPDQGRRLVLVLESKSAFKSAREHRGFFPVKRPRKLQFHLL